MIFSFQCPCRGFAALITVIILSFVLTGLAITTSASGIRARLNVREIEDSWVAGHHARTCVAIALLYLAQNRTAELSELLQQTSNTMPEATCRVHELELQENKLMLQLLGKEGASTHAVQVEVLLSPTEPPKIERWQSL